MAVNKVESLLSSIKDAFSKRDSKEEELKGKEIDLITELSEITRGMEEISYKALIEEDVESKKKHEALEVKRDKKALELEELRKKIRALDKFEVGIDTRQQALDIHKGIKAEMQAKTKEMDKKTNEYYKAKLDLEKKAAEIQDLHKEIGLLPLDLEEVIEFIEPEDIGKTKEEIEDFKENIRREDVRKRFFEIDMFENRNKGLSREDINQVLNGTMYIRPHRTR